MYRVNKSDYNQYYSFSYVVLIAYLTILQG